MGDRTGLPRQRFRRHETGDAVGQPTVLGRGGRRAARGQVRRPEAGHSALSPSPESLGKRKYLLRFVSWSSVKSEVISPKFIGIVTLEERRHQMDMLQTYKILSGKETVDTGP
jgi:hypothetical protein